MVSSVPRATTAAVVGPVARPRAVLGQGAWVGSLRGPCPGVDRWQRGKAVEGIRRWPHNFNLPWPKDAGSETDQ